MNRSHARATKRLRLVTLAPVLLLVAGVSASLFANHLQREATERQRTERFDTESLELTDTVVGELDRTGKVGAGALIGDLLRVFLGEGGRGGGEEAEGENRSGTFHGIGRKDEVG